MEQVEDENFFCDDHPEITKLDLEDFSIWPDRHFCHYGNCIYCIMETKYIPCVPSWEEEYDSWDEVVQ